MSDLTLLRSAADSETSQHGRPIWRLALDHPMALIGGGVLLALILMAISAPYLAPFSPTQQRLTSRLLPPLSGVHWLGTDQFGRDVLSRWLYGVRVPLVVGVVSALLGGVLGTAVGLTAGYFRGKVDTVISIIIDIQLSVPFVLLALAVVALFGPGTVKIIIVFALTNWAMVARVARASALKYRRAPFVEAAILAGATDRWILLRHVFVNAIPPVMVVVSVLAAQNAIYESAFAFFGLGVPPPAPSWGNMLADAKDYFYTAWWLGLFPGIGIMFVAVGMNLIGDFLRDAIDPRL